MSGVNSLFLGFFIGRASKDDRIGVGQIVFFTVGEDESASRWHNRRFFVKKR